MSGEILFEAKRISRISNTDVSACAYYNPDRESRERTASYSSLKERMDRLFSHAEMKWENPSDVCDDVMASHRDFTFFRHDGSFDMSLRNNGSSQ